MHGISIGNYLAPALFKVACKNHFFNNLHSLLKMGCYTLHPWGTTPYWLLKTSKGIFNNQYGVVPQGCNVAPHF